MPAFANYSSITPSIRRNSSRVTRRENKTRLRRAESNDEPPDEPPSLHKNAMNLLKLVRKGELAISNYGMVW